jgi:hypothetical protein
MDVICICFKIARQIVRLRFAGPTCRRARVVGHPSEHHTDLRTHYNDQQIREMMAVVGMSGFLNRYSESVAVVTDNGAANWATENLTPIGWAIGKHSGTDEEQRPELGL